MKEESAQKAARGINSQVQPGSQCSLDVLCSSYINRLPTCLGSQNQSKPATNGAATRWSEVTATNYTEEASPSELLTLLPYPLIKRKQRKLVIRHLFSLCVGKGQFCLQNDYRENATIPTVYCFTGEIKTLSITGAWQNKKWKEKKKDILPLKSLLLDENTIFIVRSDQSCN